MIFTIKMSPSPREENRKIRRIADITIADLQGKLMFCTVGTNNLVTLAPLHNTYLEIVRRDVYWDGGHYYLRIVFKHTAHSYYVSLTEFPDLDFWKHRQA